MIGEVLNNLFQLYESARLERVDHSLEFSESLLPETAGQSGRFNLGKLLTQDLYACFQSACMLT